MDKEMKVTIIVMLVSLSIAGTITVYADITKDTSATEGIDFKIFVLGNDPNIIMSKTNADYEVSGFPTTQILIKNWNKLSPLEQQTITADLNTNGYFELK
jgi:hypothetical protein